MAPKVDPDQLIAAEEAATILGLKNPNGVSVYRGRYADFPEPRVDRASCVLWLRADIEKWAKARKR